MVLSSKNSAPTTASLPSNGGNNGVKLTDRHLPWATRAVCNPRPPVSYVVLVSDRLPPPPTPLYCIGSLTGGRTIAPLPPSFARALPPSVLLHCRGGECWRGREGPYRPDTSSLASPLLFGHLVSKRKQNSGRSSGMVPEEKLQRGSFWTSRKGSSQSSTSKYSIHSRYILHIVYDYIQHLSFPLFRLDMHGSEIFLTKVKRVVLDKRHKRGRENQHERNYVRNVELSRRLRSDTRRRRIYLFL